MVLLKALCSCHKLLMTTFGRLVITVFLQYAEMVSQPMFDSWFDRHDFEWIWKSLKKCTKSTPFSVPLLGENCRSLSQLLEVND